MTKLTLIVALLSWSAMSLAQTQVPNTFQSGQPARASEVNDNFSALAAAIDQSNSSLAEVQASTQNWSQGCIDYESDFWRMDVIGVGSDGGLEAGAEIVVAGETFTYAKVPFVEHTSGDRYYIWVPMRNNEVEVFTQHDPDPLPCSDQHVLDIHLPGDSPNNFRGGSLPVQLIPSEIRKIRILNNGSLAQSIISINALVRIKLGDTIINVEIPTLSAMETEGVPSSPCCDLASVLDSGAMAHPDQLFLEIKQLTGRIRIEPAQ